MTKCFESKRPSIKTIMHLFDHTVKPVLLYGSEIWGCFIGNKLKKDDYCLTSKLLNKLKQEHVHLKFCKYLLGVGKRSTSSAVMGELGRYPLYTNIFTYMFKYFQRLYSSDDILLKNAYEESVNLDNAGKSSWYSCIKSIMKNLNINLNMCITSKYNIKSLIINKVKIIYNKIWKDDIFNDNKSRSGNKLRTYRLFKNIF